MTKQSRTLLFLVLVLIFFVAAPGIIFYSQGYRFDFENRRLTQVGAFYFNVHPPRAEIYIDGQRVGETSRFIGNSLSKNLLPKTYAISIQKEGYTSWQKRLEILPHQVTETKNITLFPNNLEFIEVQSNVRATWVAPNNRFVLLQKSSDLHAWILALWDTETETEYTMFEAEAETDEIWNIQWAPNSNSFLLQLAAQETVQAFIQKIDRNMLNNANSAADVLQIAASMRTALPFLDNTTKQIQFVPNNSNQLAFLSPGGNNAFIISLLNIQTTELEQPFTTNALSFAFSGQELFWIDSMGTLWRKQLSQNTIEEISKQTITIQNEQFYQLYVFGQEIFIETHNALYRFNTEHKTFQEIIAGPTQMSASPDAKKLAISNGKEILVLFLESDIQQPIHKKGDIELITRLSEPILNINWINSYYIDFTVGNSVQVTEIDTRDGAQVMELARTPHTNFFWQPEQEQLYIHTGSSMQTSQDFWP